jgi:hypothetical protein
MTVIGISLPGDGENWTVHDEEAPLPLRVHDVGVNEPEPLGVVVKLTVPVGVTGELLVSVTVAVQADAVLTVMEVGTQLTEVVVDLSTVRVVLPEEEKCQSSPPYDTVIPTGPKVPG